MESISTTSSLRIQLKKSVKSSVFRQRISLVRHRLNDPNCQWGAHQTELAGSGDMSLTWCFALPPPPQCSTADTSSCQTSPQAVAESADERSDQRETGYHPQECHLGRYCGFDMDSPGTILAIMEKNKQTHIWVDLFFWATRPGRGSVQQHGRRLHETRGGRGRPAAERRSQCHRLQWAAGPDRWHHGCVQLSTWVAASLVCVAFYTFTYESESLQVRSCGLKG